jgi:Protein of unknown function (DUF1574)
MIELKSFRNISTAAVALAGFAFINVLVNISSNGDELRFVNNNGVYQNITVFRFMLRAQSLQQVVFLGSSIMETPFAVYEGDSGHYTTTAQTTEKWFTCNTDRHIGVANLSLGGAMISDQYILLKKILSSSSPMPVLVLGITPRDFIDYRFSQPAQTNAFRALVRLTDIELWPMYIQNTKQFLTFITDELFTLFRYRTILDWYIGKVIGDRLDLVLKLVNPGASNNVSSQAGPSQQSALRFQHSLEEYARVYSNADNDVFYRRQKNFLKRFLTLCHQFHIQLLLINMPISTINRNLMTTGFYKKFEEDISNLACANEIVFLNAARSKDFKYNEDYWDTAHLNKTGGEKLNNLMCPLINKMLRTAQ